MAGLDLDTSRGRLVVDEFMSVPGAPDIYACGDCAAVPDLTRPHHDLGFVVDLGGLAAAANPLNIPLSGLPASVFTRAYHLVAMAGNRARARRLGPERHSARGSDVLRSDRSRI